MPTEASLDDELPPVPDDVEALARQLVARLDPPGDPRIARELIESALGLLTDGPDPLDLKIAAAAMTEMREAFAVFAPYEQIPKANAASSSRQPGGRNVRVTTSPALVSGTSIVSR